ncbi:MAG: hypothetical protein KGJ60_14680 [Verrucomicrobiota bacterium]|nr:hypothetical protein [Verrucomicrobiota bacterium]
MILGKLRFNWLQDNPRRWAGKKVQCKKTDVIYTIHQVLGSGRVILEKRWMLYTSTVQVIRRDYEPASP